MEEMLENVSNKSAPYSHVISGDGCGQSSDLRVLNPVKNNSVCPSGLPKAHNRLLQQQSQTSEDESNGVSRQSCQEMPDSEMDDSSDNSCNQ